MKDFVYYPIYVTTLNRYEHFRRLVESLQKNTDADKTELVIGLDYPPNEKYRDGYEKNRDYIPTISGFKKVTVFTTDMNLGPYENSIRLKEYIRKQGYDACIITEDDNEFSPNFIQYMNWGLNKFRDDNSIYAICGCMSMDTNDVPGEIFKLNKLFAGWGVGQWFNRRDKLRKYFDLHYQKEILDKMPFSILFSDKIYKANAILSMIRGGWAFGDTIPIFLPDEERWCVFPVRNKVRNWGWDGTGQHGGSPESYQKYSTLPIDERLTFEGDSRKDIFSSLMEQRFNKEFKHTVNDYLKASAIYIVYKLTGKILVGNRQSKWCKVKLQKVL